MIVACHFETKTAEANLAENGWGQSAPAQFRSGDDKTERFGYIDMASTRGRSHVYSTWHAPERERGICRSFIPDQSPKIPPHCKPV